MVATVEQGNCGMVGSTDSESRPLSRLEGRYLLVGEQVRSLGAWLLSAPAADLPGEQWEAEFSRYSALQGELQELGEELRPQVLRDRREVLAGEALEAEVRELFA